LLDVLKDNQTRNQTKVRYSDHQESNIANVVIIYVSERATALFLNKMLKKSNVPTNLLS